MKKFGTLVSSALLCVSVTGCAMDDMKDSPNSMKSAPMNDAKMGDSKAKMAMATMDIIETAVGPGMTEVTTLVTAIKAADLVTPLKGEGPFTVFAPTNAAFNKLPPGTVEDLLKPENKAKLQSILLYHVHKGDAVLARDVQTMNLSTLNGKDLKVVVSDGNVMINNAKVIKTDVVAKNGIIHWVDTVILP